jgi:tetratricopeptide (TPR) repeat protein
MPYRLLAALLLCCSAQAAELPWDLSYQSALRDHPIAENEFMRIWPQQHPQRPIHDRLAAYKGEPIEASLLIERPDIHAGDAQATWFIVTRSGAQACPFHPLSLKQPCQTLDRERVQNAIRQIMLTPDPRPPAGQGTVGDANYFGQGKPLLMNYMGYVSAYIDGKVLQRPVSLTELDPAAQGPEAGRLVAILQRAVATDGVAGARPVASEPAVATEVEDEKERKARSALIEEVQGYLIKSDYKKLDALRNKLLKSQERTPSGVWKLAIFYNQLKEFPGRSREPEYWVKREAGAKAWEKQAPTSGAARIFHAYVLLARGLSYRGSAFYDKVPREDIKRMLAAIDEGNAVLFYAEKQLLKDKDPELFRVRMTLTPWGDNFRALSNRTALDKAIALYPDYHETYFTAALYGSAMWHASPDEIDEIARRGSKAGGADAAAMYARVYWYANRDVYEDKLFDDPASLVDWDTMKTSFEALVARYPDAWNLNAYANFACQARDYPTMDAVLRRAGDKRVYQTWRNGEGGYADCLTHSGEPRVRQAAADIRKREDTLYRGLLYFASAVARKQGYMEESLRALDKAEPIGMRIYTGGPNMPLYYHRARALLVLKRYDETVTALTTGLPHQPDYFEAYYYRGLAYEALGRLDEAQRDFEQAGSLLQKLKREGKLVFTGTDEQKALYRTEMGKMLAKFKQYNVAAPEIDL